MWQQADNLCNSVGILQQTSQPSPLAGGKSAHHALDTDHTQLFAQMIARTGKDIEVRGVDTCSVVLTRAELTRGCCRC